MNTHTEYLYSDTAGDLYGPRKDPGKSVAEWQINKSLALLGIKTWDELEEGTLLSFLKSKTNIYIY